MTAAKTRTQIPVTPLGELAEDWAVHLGSRNREATIKAYMTTVQSFLRWYAAQGPGEPVLDRATVDLYLADLRRAGQSPGTLRLRFAALKVFSKWLAREGERDRDLLDGVDPPAPSKPRIAKLSDAEVEAMLRACRGSRFQDYRDKAIMLLLLDTGLRASELTGLTVDDVDYRHRRVAHVRHGKGDKERWVAFSPRTADAIAVYVRKARNRHKLAYSDRLWLGIPASSGRFGYQGVAQALGKRAKAAGVQGFHIHRIRHTWASNLLRDGASEGTVKTLAGWASSAMLAVYTHDTAQERAVEEFRRLRG